MLHFFPRSMYFDEDGDLAHEFYCQVFDRKTNKVVMQKYSGDLKPQVNVTSYSSIIFSSYIPL